jgi:hypothetical protein
MRAFNPAAAHPPWRWMIYSDRFTRAMHRKGLLFHLRDTKERPLNLSLSFERVREGRLIEFRDGNMETQLVGARFQIESRVRLIRERARMHSRGVALQK